MHSMFRTLLVAGVAMGLCGVVGVGPSAAALITVQFSAEVVIGPDGNGVTTATFPTTDEGPFIRYYLRIENGCRGSRLRCRTGTPVTAIQITLNGNVVYENADPMTGPEKLEVALIAVGGGPNLIAVSAFGEPGAVARFRVIASASTPAADGRSIVPLARTTAGPPLDGAMTSVSVHNAGSADLYWRLEFFNADGTVSGRTAAAVAAPRATSWVDLTSAVSALGIGWTVGTVHVHWVSAAPTRAVAGAANSSGATIVLPNLDTTPASNATLYDISGGAVGSP